MCRLAYPPPVATLGEHIRALRKRAGFKTQVDLAEKMGVQSQTISDWENNRRDGLDMESLVRLSESLNCFVDEIINGPWPDQVRQAHGVQAAAVPKDGSHAPAQDRLSEREGYLEGVLEQIADEAAAIVEHARKAIDREARRAAPPETSGGPTR